jgi:hypothetical protein
MENRLNGKNLLVASSVFLGLAGAAALFAPVELLRALGFPSPGVFSVIVQLLGALYFSFACLNWTAKDNAIGGIYSRPVSLGNMTHFVIGSLSLAKWELANERNLILLFATIAYAMFAFLFAVLFFGSGPVGEKR